ncbi:MAG: PP2C family protein-serine/threonine phosphatase [Pseudomonadota bacterium]|nr:PP2C family protein-serine/threonine phosphatase [Pseudomonadota bacterium]
MPAIYVLATASKSGRLTRHLKSAGFLCEVVESAQQIPVHDQRAGLATVLCSTIGDLLECHNPSLTPVYFCESELSVEAMLQALANGAADCWALSMSAEQLRERADALLNRVEQKLATGLRAEGDDQHAAARLSTLEQELQEDQRAGQSIQLGMLPKQNKVMAGYRFSRWVQPSLILSGDFIDYFPLQDRYLACFLADVAGHGASSALLTVMLKNISWRLQQKFGLPSFNSPGDLLAWINETLIGQGIEKHVAMFLGIIDIQDNTLHYSMAAQYPPALLCGPNGHTQLLQQQAKPLGLFSDARYASEQLPFLAGSTLLVFSDGVMDCLPADQFADKEAALVALSQSLPEPLKIWSRLCESLKNLDDVSLLAVQRERSA